jgi:endopolyphosphatase
MLGYSQWVLDLQGHNKRHQKDAKKAEEQGLAYHLEYTTYDEQTLWSDFFDEQDSPAHVHRPVPKALLDHEIRRRKAKAPALVSSPSLFIGHLTRHIPILRSFTTTVRKPKLSKRLRHLTDYRLPSMTIAHVLDLARELAGNDKLWARYERRIYTESGFEG